MLAHYSRAACLLGTIVMSLLAACTPMQVQAPAPSPGRMLTATLQIAGDGVQVNGRPAVSGQAISPGDQVWTGTQSSALVRFSDNTTIQVIDATEPVSLNWSGDRLVLRMDDAAIEASKGFIISVIEAIGDLAHIFHESSFVVEEKRARFFRLDLFSGRAHVVRPPTARTVLPGQYALVTPDGQVKIGRTSQQRLRELRSRFGRWDFNRVVPLRVPNLIDRHLEEALAEIKRAGLGVGRISGRQTRDSYVVSQDPRPGMQVRPGSNVNLTLKGQAVRPVVVPDLRERSYAEARKMLGDRRLETGRVSGPQTRDSYVVSQDPRPGMRVRPGSRVNLALQGQTTVKTVQVPDLRRRLLRDALDQLARAGLKAGRIDGGRAGDAFYVVGQSPEAGRRVPLGSTVDLKVQGVLQ